MSTNLPPRLVCRRQRAVRIAVKFANGAACRYRGQPCRRLRYIFETVHENNATIAFQPPPGPRVMLTRAFDCQHRNPARMSPTEQANTSWQGNIACCLLVNLSPAKIRQIRRRQLQKGHSRCLHPSRARLLQTRVSASEPPPSIRLTSALNSLLRLCQRGKGRPSPLL